MNFNNLPEEMRAMPNWSCYKTYTDKEGKRKKVIISPKDGNSIAVNVLMALFGQIYGVPWRDKVFKERKKTEEELLRELPLFAYMKDNAA